MTEWKSIETAPKDGTWILLRGCNAVSRPMIPRRGLVPAAMRYQAGDLVTRDGTDIHRVTREDDGYGCISVVCVVAPKDGWAKVGDIEDNLAGRYSQVTESPEAIAARLMAPASTSALWTYDQVRVLLIRALTEGADNQNDRPSPSVAAVPPAKL